MEVLHPAGREEHAPFHLVELAVKRRSILFLFSFLQKNDPDGIVPSNPAQVVTSSIDVRRAIRDASPAVRRGDQAGSAANARGGADGRGRIGNDRTGRTRFAPSHGGFLLVRIVPGWAGDASGSVRGQALSTGEADGCPSVRRIGHVDALDPGRVRVEDPHSLDAGAESSAVAVLLILSDPGLLLERPAESVGAVLGDGVGEVLPGQPPAPGLDHGDPFGRRALSRIPHKSYELYSFEDSAGRNFILTRPA